MSSKKSNDGWYLCDNSNIGRDNCHECECGMQQDGITSSKNASKPTRKFCIVCDRNSVGRYQKPETVFGKEHDSQKSRKPKLCPCHENGYCSNFYNWGHGKYKTTRNYNQSVPHPFLAETIGCLNNFPYPFAGIKVQNWNHCCCECRRNVDYPISEYTRSYSKRHEDSSKAALKTRGQHPSLRRNESLTPQWQETLSSKQADMTRHQPNLPVDCRECKIKVFQPQKVMASAADGFARVSAPIEKMECLDVNHNIVRYPTFLDHSDNYGGYIPKNFRKQEEMFSSRVADLRGRQLDPAYKQMHGQTYEPDKNDHLSKERVPCNCVHSQS